MVRLVDPQRLNGDPFRLAVPLLAEIIPGGIGIRRDRTAPGIDFDHAEARTDTRGRCGRKYPTLGRNADTDQPEIIFERLYGFQGWADFTRILGCGRSCDECASDRENSKRHIRRADFCHSR